MSSINRENDIKTEMIGFRVDKATKSKLVELAKRSRRKLGDFVRLQIEDIVASGRIVGE